MYIFMKFFIVVFFCFLSFNIEVQGQGHLQGQVHTGQPGVHTGQGQPTLGSLGDILREYDADNACGTELEKTRENLNNFINGLDKAKQNDKCNSITKHLKQGIPSLQDIEKNTVSVDLTKELNKEKRKLRAINNIGGQEGGHHLLLHKAGIEARISRLKMELRQNQTSNSGGLKVVSYAVVINKAEEYSEKIRSAMDSNCFTNKETKQQALISLTSLAGMALGSSSVGLGLISASRIVSTVFKLTNKDEGKGVREWMDAVDIKCAFQNINKQYCESVKSKKQQKLIEKTIKSESEASFCEDCLNNRPGFFKNINIIPRIINKILEKDDKDDDRLVKSFDEFMKKKLNPEHLKSIEFFSDLSPEESEKLKEYYNKESENLKKHFNIDNFDQYIKFQKKQLKSLQSSDWDKILQMSEVVKTQLEDDRTVSESEVYVGTLSEEEVKTQKEQFIKWCKKAESCKVNSDESLTMKNSFMKWCVTTDSCNINPDKIDEAMGIIDVMNGKIEELEKLPKSGLSGRKQSTQKRKLKIEFMKKAKELNLDHMASIMELENQHKKYFDEEVPKIREGISVVIPRAIGVGVGVNYHSLANPYDVYDLSNDSVERDGQLNARRAAFLGMKRYAEAAGETFKSNLINAINVYSKESNHEKNLAEMCMIALGSAVSNNNKLNDKCESKSYKIETFTIEYDDYKNLPAEERVCVFQDFKSCVSAKGNPLAPSCIANQNRKEKNEEANKPSKRSSENNLGGGSQ